MKSMDVFALSAVTLLAVVACGGGAGEPSSESVTGDEAPAEPGGTASPPTTPAPPAPPPGGSSASAPCSGKAALAGDLEWKVSSGGRTRTVHVHVPTAYDATKPTPVVLNFHGFTSNALEQAGYSGMTRKADEARFIAVHPEGVGSPQSWNAGACCGEAAESSVDDVAFVGAILDEVESKLCVDDKRVFATGMSNGGFLSHRLACELSTRIAAVAPVAGVLGVPTCTPARPVPVMHFHGTLDALVPYAGIDSVTRSFPSVADTVDGWAQRNGCTDTPRTTVDRGDVVCATRDKCAAGAEVTLCTVSGGGHTWPGGIPVVAMGHTTSSIRATDAMWSFFERHPMP